MGRSKKVYISGRRIKTEAGKHTMLPIKDDKQLKALLDYLVNKYEHARSDIKRYQAYRNYMIVLIGVNTAFRAEDLLQLKVRDVESGYVSIRENKTGKMNNFPMSKKLKQEITKYIDYNNLKSTDYLFLGQIKTRNDIEYIYPITRQYARRMVSDAGKAVGIMFSFGLHSLRKTFGYMYVRNGGNIETLRLMLNHEDPNVTKRYICWATDDAERERKNIFIGKSFNG